MWLISNWTWTVIVKKVLPVHDYRVEKPFSCQQQLAVCAGHVWLWRDKNEVISLIHMVFNVVFSDYLQSIEITLYSYDFYIYVSFIWFGAVVVTSLNTGTRTKGCRSKKKSANSNQSVRRNRNSKNGMNGFNEEQILKRRWNVRKNNNNSAAVPHLLMILNCSVFMLNSFYNFHLMVTLSNLKTFYMQMVK